MGLVNKIGAYGSTFMSLKYCTSRQDFLFKFVLLAADPKNHTVMFDTLQDWCWELERTKGHVKYKAVSVNEGYKVGER